MVETQGEKVETHSYVSTGNNFSHCGCRTVQKLHIANTAGPRMGGALPPLKDPTGEYIWKGCQLMWGQRDIGKGLSISKGNKENLKLKILALLDSVHCAKC